MVEELFLDDILKNWNWAYLCVNSLKYYRICSYCMPSWGLSKYIETKLKTICFYLIESFLKNKKRSVTSLPALFSTWFLQTNISLREMLGNICIAIVC